MFFRINQILLLILISLAVLQDQLWLAWLLMLPFTYYFGAVWLVVLAIGVDAYFGAFSTIPFFSLVLLGWYVLSEFLRFRLRIINKYG